MDILKAASIVGITTIGTVEVGNQFPVNLSVISGPATGVYRILTLNGFFRYFPSQNNTCPDLYLQMIMKDMRMNDPIRMDAQMVYSNIVDLNDQYVNFGSTYEKSDLKIKMLGVEPLNVNRSKQDSIKVNFVNKNEPIYLSAGQTISLSLMGATNGGHYVAEPGAISFICSYEEFLP